MLNRLVIALTPLLLLALSAASEESPAASWSPGSSETGEGFAYQIYSRESQGEAYLLYQVRGSINASPDTLRRSVRTIASDPERAPEGHTRRLLSADDDVFVVYTLIDLPLIADRDIITRGVASVDPTTGTERIDWQAIDDHRAPPGEDAVRIRSSGGFWEFVPAANGTTRVTYETFIDLGGSLPGWLINPLMARTVSANFENLAREAVSRTAPPVAASPPPSG